MQSAFTKHPALRLSAITLACQLVCLGMSSAYAQTTTDSEPSVTIVGGKAGMGLMVQENAPKARSTVTKEELAKQRPTGNVYDALTLLPSVNTYSHDATGLFGGGLTLRGFNSDQIGATINGVPVNDSGSFSVYPQEFVDPENTCEESVTQGSTDIDAPQVGATGGNFGVTTCEPEAKRRIRVMQTLGSLHMSKTFARFDTGLLADGRSKFFVSVSHAETDKWKGEGRAKRDHVDLGFNYDHDRFNFAHGTILINRAVNSNISTFNLADLNKFGYNYDYSTSFVGHVTPTKGKADSDVNQAFADAYYKLTQNPFENMIASTTIKLRLNDDTDIKILPYFWYGYGTGSNQQRLQTESAFLNSATGKLTAGVDLNGDGDTLDKVIVANSSVTQTYRPGITASITRAIGDHVILAGFWWERARHRQTGPMVAVDAAGNPADIWLRNGWINRPDGTPFESRDWLTISTASQFFLQDTVSMDKWTVNAGVRAPRITRDFTNYANEATNAGLTYKMERTYSDVLPQLGVRYQINNDQQLFASISKNMKAPPNTVFATTSNVQIINGVPTLSNDVKAELSTNVDIGYRYQSNNFTAQATVYSVDFKDRQLNAYDPVSQTSSLANVGKVSNQGFELEGGNKPINGWSFYGSVGYSKSEVKEDVLVSKGVTLPTAGKVMPLTPEWKTGLSAQYETPVWYTRLKAKYTSTQQATVVNDEEIPSYTLVDLDAGYMFPSNQFVKQPTLRFNISNIFNQKYRNPQTLNALNATVINGVAAKNVFYYMGAPRFVSVTLQADF